MKTKNMRKKALLSSVAMLLVAVVALGGATYAWFTTSTIVSATGLQLTTGAESNLQIALGTTAPGTTSTDWKQSVDFDVTKQLTPMSSYNGTTFFTITSVEDASNPGDDTQKVESITSTGVNPEYVEFWVRNQKTTTQNLRITAITNNDTNAQHGSAFIYDGLRVAVFIDTGSGYGQTPVYLCAPSTNADTTVKAIKSATGYVANAVTVADLYAGSDKNNVAFEAPTLANSWNTTNLTTSGMTANQAYHVKVVFWLEGNATTNTSIGKTLDDITITVGLSS